MRDYVDTKNSLDSLETLSSLEAVAKGFTDDMTKEANVKLKLCKRQARRVYEIARLHWARKAGGLTNFNDAYTDYRVAVKKRLNVPYQVNNHYLILFD